MARSRLLAPAVWGFYLVVGLEFLFMISPLALYFYASHGPLLNLLHASAWTSWLTSFFLPHFSVTASPLLNSLRRIGLFLAGAGLLLFLVGAVHVYSAKLLRRGAVMGGIYRWVRHPQYLALAILGLGTTLVWPRFLVLLSYLTMLFLYVLLAKWEEDQCVEQFGETYRAYQLRTGMILPRLPGSRPAGWGRLMREAHWGFWAVAYALTLVAGTAMGLALRTYSLHQLTSLYTEKAAVLSPALLTPEELARAFRIAFSSPELSARLARLQPSDRLLVHVVPGTWYLPDLPLHSMEEIRRVRGGHRTPEFDRHRFQVLVTRARLHSPDLRGMDIVKAAHGRDPVLIVDVDIGTGSVLGERNPPEHVFWGDVPTPLF